MSQEQTTTAAQAAQQNESANGEATEAMPAGEADAERETRDAGEPRGGGEEKFVPVSEAIRYRKRAQAAEQQLTQMQSSISQAQGELNEARATIARLERRQRIDELLADSEAVDMEVARLLTEAAVEMMDEPDVAAAISDLRRHKPYLFRRRNAATASAMSARHADHLPHAANDAAEQALASGNRRDLLRYLRLRRSA